MGDLFTQAGMVGLLLAVIQTAKTTLGERFRGWMVLLAVAVLAAALIAIKTFAPPAFIAAVSDWVALVGAAAGSATLASKAKPLIAVMTETKLEPIETDESKGLQ